MRTFFHTTAFMLLATSAFANKDLFRAARDTGRQLQDWRTSHICCLKLVVTAITLRVASADYAVPASECAVAGDSSFESVSLLWHGAYKSAAEADYFYFYASTWALRTRERSRVAPCSVDVRDRKFGGMKVTKKTAQNVKRDSQL